MKLPLLEVLDDSLTLLLKERQTKVLRDISILIVYKESYEYASQASHKASQASQGAGQASHGAVESCGPWSEP